MGGSRRKILGAGASPWKMSTQAPENATVQPGPCAGKDFWRVFFEMRRRTCRYRDSEGVERVWGFGKGVRLHSFVSSPAGSARRSRGRKHLFSTFHVTERSRWKENIILLFNMVTILTTANAEIY